MKCSDVEMEVVTLGKALWSAGVREHVAACAECQALAERQARISQLLSIPRHEVPDAHFEMRTLARVRGAIQSEKPGKLWWAHPMWRVSLAAAAALALVVMVPRWGAQKEGSSPAVNGPGSVAALAPVVEISKPVEAYATGAESVLPHLKLQEFADYNTWPATITNRPDRLGPIGIDYGMGDSATVEFKY